MVSPRLRFLVGAVVSTAALYVLATLFVPDPTAPLPTVAAGALAVIGGVAVAWYDAPGRSDRPSG